VNQFVVVRTFATKKRKFCIAVGTFSTRYAAKAYLEHASREFTIPRTELQVGVFRKAKERTGS